MQHHVAEEWSPQICFLCSNTCKWCKIVRSLVLIKHQSLISTCGYSYLNIYVIILYMFIFNFVQWCKHIVHYILILRFCHWSVWMQSKHFLLILSYSTNIYYLVTSLSICLSRKSVRFSLYSMFMLENHSSCWLPNTR